MVAVYFGIISREGVIEVLVVETQVRGGAGL